VSEPASEPAGTTGTARLLAIDPEGYQSHPLHAGERMWTETNCYVDLWIEVLHALGMEPLAVCAFTLSTDFQGDQWTFFKFPPEDLRAAYGIEVAEMNVWRPMLEHAFEQLQMGRLLTIEVDAWFLPDTAGVSYGSDHVKTTIVPEAIDLGRRRLGYFHNAGYFVLEGDDFDGVFRRGRFADPDSLPPYVELVRLERARRDGDVVEQAMALAVEHLARRPADNPMLRFRKRLEEDVAWLAGQDLSTFHLYAFGTCRQCGATAELAASFVDWLAASGVDRLDGVADHFRAVAEAAKALQVGLARAVRGRAVDLDGPVGQMERGWEAAMAGLVQRCGA
jgi:hypothetical protein